MILIGLLCVKKRESCDTYIQVQASLFQIRHSLNAFRPHLRCINSFPLLLLCLFVVLPIQKKEANTKAIVTTDHSTRFSCMVDIAELDAATHRQSFAHDLHDRGCSADSTIGRQLHFWRVFPKPRQHKKKWYFRGHMNLLPSNTLPQTTTLYLIPVRIPHNAATRFVLHAITRRCGVSPCT